MIQARVLGLGDEAALEAFLLRHADASIFLRANLRRSGIVDAPGPFHGTYAAAFADGAMVAAAGHFWNDNICLVAPVAAGEVARLAAATTGRRVAGLVGPWAHLLPARAALGLDDAPTNMSSRDLLFALALDDLVVPAPLARGALVCRAPAADEFELVVAWRLAYHLEILGSPAGPDTERAARTEIERTFGSGDQFVVSEPGGPALSFSAFNARLPDVVQIGGVYTPPPARGRGLARACVAGSLLVARAQGVTRSVLFTGEDNPAACKAYAGIGYRVVGEYGLILFAAHT